METEELKDWRGTPIAEGSTVVYPGRHSSSLWLTEGTVRAISYGEPDWRGNPRPRLLVDVVRTSGYRSTNRPALLTNVNMVTVVG